jgi:hypothetical protein
MAMTAPQQPIDAPEAWSTPEQRERMLEQMRAVSSGFYMQAVRIGCHPFIEFAGLMNEYIKCCAEAHKQGIDFTRCNAHTGHHLPMRPFEVKYVNEKLECIFTGRTEPAMRQAALSAIARLLRVHEGRDDATSYTLAEQMLDAASPAAGVMSPNQG